MTESKTALIISIAAAVFSGGSAMFTALQWNEARLTRLSQAESALRTGDEQKKTRELAQAQTMAAERAAITAQRQRDPFIGGNEADMPSLECQYSLYRSFQMLLPLSDRGYSDRGYSVAPGARATDSVTKFIEYKGKKVTVSNRGGSTAYSLSAVNRAAFGDPDGLTQPTGVAGGDSFLMLAPGSSIDLPVKDDRPPTAEAVDLFRKGEASYYIIGRFEYRDVFQKVRSAWWCYENRVKRHVDGPEIENRPCQLGEKTFNLGTAARIESEGKD